MISKEDIRNQRLGQFIYNELRRNKLFFNNRAGKLAIIDLMYEINDGDLLVIIHKWMEAISDGKISS